MYAVIGMELFSNKFEIDEITNFNHFGFAMLTLVQLLTNSDWMGKLGNPFSIPSSQYLYLFIQCGSVD